MPGIGIITNVVAILLGGLLGRGCGRFISERFQETPMRACALAVIFLVAGAIEPIITPAALANLSYIGNILIFCVGTNLLGLPHIRVANFFPALVIAILWQ